VPCTLSLLVLFLAENSLVSSLLLESLHLATYLLVFPLLFDRQKILRQISCRFFSEGRHVKVNGYLSKIE